MNRPIDDPLDDVVTYLNGLRVDNTGTSFRL